MYDDNDGCFDGIIYLALIGAFLGALKWIGIAALVILAIVLIVFAVRAYNNHQVEKENEAKKMAERIAAEKRAKEDESYLAYIKAQTGSPIAPRLQSVNTIISRLRDEEDEEKHEKIIVFFDRYLPLITEIIEASKHGAIDSDESVDRFIETVKNFSKSLYNVDDVVEVSSSVMESLAIRDGLYSPYEAEFGSGSKTANENNDE